MASGPITTGSGPHGTVSVFVGPLFGSAVSGASRTTVRRALESLAVAGKVAIQANHAGTVLRLL